MFSPAIKLPLTQSIIKTVSKYKIQGKYILYFDGCCKGNPGTGGAGAVLYKNNIEIWSDSKFVGENVTNNIAEYTGMLIGLEYAAKQDDIDHLLVKGDSQLVIKQMQGEYNVNSIKLVDLYQSAKKLACSFIDIEFQHVHREANKRADTLSNEGLLKKY